MFRHRETPKSPKFSSTITPSLSPSPTLDGTSCLRQAESRLLVEASEGPDLGASRATHSSQLQDEIQLMSRQAPPRLIGYHSVRELEDSGVSTPGKKTLQSSPPGRRHGVTLRSTTAMSIATLDNTQSYFEKLIDKVCRAKDETVTTLVDLVLEQRKNLHASVVATLTINTAGG
jgi:hypothetical protein